MTPAPDLYALLGVSKKARPAAVKKAYRKASLVHHPDRGGDRGQFERVHLAYEVLTDPDRRKKYDATGEVGPDPRIDNSLAVVAEALAPVFQQVLIHLVKQNLKAGEHDLAKMAREGCQQTRANYHGELQAQKRSAELLREAVGRFEQDGETNLLRSVAEMHLKQAEAAVVKLTEIVGHFDRAIEYLKKSKYRHKAKPVPFSNMYVSTSSSTV